MKIEFLITVTLAALILALPYQVHTVGAAARRDLSITWYPGSDSAFTALRNNQVDLIQWSLTKQQKETVEGDPNLQISMRAENGMTEFDLNNNVTIADYPTSTNPCYVTNFRKFLSRMIDKDYIISSILNRFAVRIDAPVSYPQIEDWVDTSVVTYDANHNGVIEPEENNYPYPFSISEAVNLLADMGFSDTNADGYLEYPNDAGVWYDAAAKSTRQMPLKICIRTDENNRLAAGQYLVSQLEGDPAIAGDSALALSPQWTVRGMVGGDFDTTDVTWQQPRSVLRPVVMGARNYHVYTGSWSVGRFPLHLYSMFHSFFWYPYGANYVTANVHPDEDHLLEELFYAASLSDAQSASHQYTHEHVINVKNIPLWSYAVYETWRKEICGVVNMDGYGIINDWTFLNTWHSNSSSPLRFGGVASWDILNIMYSQWYFEYALLDRVYGSLLNVNPYDLASEIPWFAQDWEISTWTDPRDGSEKTTVTYWFNKAIGCAAPETGTYSGRFNATDYIFTVWYNYAFDDDWQWSSFMDINHVERLNDFAAKVYFDDKSMWFKYSPTYPMLGPSTRLAPMLCSSGSASFTGADLIESPPSYFEYFFTTDRVVLVTSATVNGVLMTEGVDFYIRGGYDVFTHNVFVPLRSFAVGDTIVINYYYATANGAGGTYLGGNLGYDWTDTMYAYGYQYPISINATTATLNRNQYYFLETIPKGEIDFRWYWGTGAKPRSGNYKIDILDVVQVTGSYSTRGDQAYNSLYLPSADLDDSDLCHVGILDLSTVTSKYAMPWGRPPA